MSSAQCADKEGSTLALAFGLPGNQRRQLSDLSPVLTCATDLSRPCAIKALYGHSTGFKLPVDYPRQLFMAPSSTLAGLVNQFTLTFFGKRMFAVSSIRLHTHYRCLCILQS